MLILNYVFGINIILVPCEIFLCFAKAFGQPLKTTHRVVFLTLSFKSLLLSVVKQKRTSEFACPFCLAEKQGIDKALFFGKLLYNRILYNVPYRQENMAQIWHKLLTKRLLRFALPG